MAKFTPRLGQPPSGWDNQAFANVGDLVHNNAVIVNWEQENFNQTAQVRIPTVDTIAAALAAEDPAHPIDLLGPYNNGDAGTEVVKVRRTVYLPACFARHFIDTPLSPKTARQIMSALIIGTPEEAALTQFLLGYEFHLQTAIIMLIHQWLPVHCQLPQ